MAEFVQRRVEDQIPELEQLERVGLLTAREVRQVIRKRTALEYKLKRRVVEKESFIGYVQYELNFLELLKKRRQRIGYSFKKKEIENMIVSRIHELFSRATNKWKEDLQLWMSHVAFCKKWNQQLHLSKVFSSMLAVHPNKPELWIMAAKWEFEDHLSAESARHVFLRALRFHPDCAKLYQEYFRMELMNAEKQKKEKEELKKANMDLGADAFSESILRGALAEAVYKAATQKITGAEFHLSLLAIARKFDFTKELQAAIMEDLQHLHAGDPLTWDFLAREELSAQVSPSAEAPSNQKAQEAGLREERCVEVYRRALTSLQTEPMYDLYIAFCWERYKRKTNNGQLRLQRRERLLTALSEAHGAERLLLARYTEWVSLLVELGEAESALDVSLAATLRFPSSLDAWRTRLELLVATNTDTLQSEFDKATAAVTPQEVLPLWTLMMDWCEEERTEEETEALYEKLVLLPLTSRPMKVRYLDWSLRRHGYKRARKVFSRLKESRPLPLDFFQKMIDIEKQQDGGGKMENLRDYYERALREFGSTHPDLWIAYIREELSHAGGRAENCGAIHWRAMKMLQGGDVERFTTSYTLLQTGHL